jgi:hypothetical protein
VLVPDEMREAPGVHSLDQRTWGVAFRARYGEYRPFGVASTAKEPAAPRD